MTMQSDAAVDRRRKQVAAKYRKQGYRVVVPAASGEVPAFLSGCYPDIIAEKDGDNVVIEVKRSSALQGANDLLEMTERVAAVAGWRLEVVALRGEDAPSGSLPPGWLESTLRRPAVGTNGVVHGVYVAVALECLIHDLAAKNGIRFRDKTPRRLAAELTYTGVIDQHLLDRIEAVFTWRNAAVYDGSFPGPASDQVRQMEEVCRDLQALSLAPEA